MSKNSTISLRSRWLSEKLKAARLQAGHTLVDAAEYLQMDHGTLSRFERGTHRIRRSYVKDLLDFYGVSSPRDRDFLLKLSEDTWRKDWSDMDSYDLDVEFVDYTWLEAKSVMIRVFEPLLIHGLLQTPQYIEALTMVEQGVDVTSPEPGHVVNVRTRRQKILGGHEPTHLTVITEEPALHRPIGGMSTLRRQLTHLLDIGKEEHIDIRVLTMSTPADPGHHGPFTIFEMPDPYPAIAYVEDVVGRTFYEDEGKVARFQRTYDEIDSLALTSTQSRRLIEDILKETE